jgi:hypothetical protein
MTPKIKNLRAVGKSAGLTHADALAGEIADVEAFR